jgi:hypothetical protein
MAAPEMQGGPQRGGEPGATAGSYDVFLSHNGKDKPAVRVLAERLTTEGLEPFLDAWHLVPGEPWQEALEEALLASRTCAVFLGPAGMGSWENEEMRAALSQRVRNPDYRVIPVLLPGAEFPLTGRLPAFLSRTTWVDFRPGLDDAQAFERLVSGIKGVAPEEEVVDPSASVNPFRGLEVFDEAHAEFFFGRDALTQQLVEQLREDRFLAVIGPSGSGKSSVVRAGLIPQLRQGGLPGSASWPVVVMRPGSHPLESLAARLVPVLELPGSPIAEQGAILDLLGKDERGLHNAISTVVATGSADARVVIVVDQFEEIFAPDADAHGRDRFVANLLYASSIAGGQAVVVLTMRADFFGKCASIPALAARIADRDVLVSPMSEEELREAIVKPAQRVGLELEKGLVDTILDDLGAGLGVLPLLELTLLELWEGRRGRWLTVDRYGEIDGVHGAIAKRAEAAFARLTADQQRAARRVLLRLTSPGDGTEDSRRRATLAELVPPGPGAGDARAVIDELTNARLLTTNEEPGGEVIDVAHEALIRSWPRLHEWVAEDPAALRVHRRLTETANAWLAAGRDPSDLYRGSRLDEALKWASRDPEELNESERAFLDASVRQRDQDLRTRERRRLIVGAGIGIAVFAIAATAVVALVNWQRAESERGLAEQAAATAAARLALAEGQGAAPDDPSLGLRLVAEGLDRAMRAGIDTAPFREELIRGLLTGRYAQLGTEVATFEMVGDGSSILVDNGTGNGRLWRLRDAAPLAELPAAIALERPTFSIPDTIEDESATLFLVRYEGRPGIELRNVTDGSVVDLAGVADSIDFVGDRVVVRYPVEELPDDPDAEYGGPWTADIRSGADGRLIASIDEPFTELSIVDGTSWGSAFVEREEAVELIDLDDGRAIGGWAGFGSDFFPLDRQFAALTTATRHCLVIGARDGRTRRDLPGPCQFFAISNDATVLAVAPLDGDIELLLAADSEPVATIPAGVRSWQFSPQPGASRILLVDTKQRVKLIDTATGRLISDLDGAVIPQEFEDTAFPNPVAFSPNGARVILRTGAEDGSSLEARVFDSATGRRIKLGIQFSGENDQTPWDVSFSMDHDGTYMVARYDDREELLRSDGSVVRLAGRPGTISLWQEGAGPILVAYLDGFAELIDWETGASLGRLPVPATYGWAFRPAPEAAAIMTEEIDDPEKQLPVVIVSVDGTWFESPGWRFTSFSPDPEASTFVVERANGAFELWDRSGERLLARLGLGVTYVDFTPDGSILAVRYVTGELYLVSVADLRALPPSIESATDEALLELACSGGVGSTVSESRLQAAMGDPPVSCR